jgi:hypothetical protein
MLEREIVALFPFLETVVDDPTDDMDSSHFGEARLQNSWQQ